MDTLARGATGVAGAALVGMAGVEVWQVFARYVLNASPGWTEPVALLLLVTAMGLGAASGVRSGAHFGFFIVVQSARPAMRRILERVSQAIIAAVGLMLAWWGGELFLDGIAVPMAGAAMPQSMPFLPLAVSGALMFAFSIERIVAVPATALQEHG
jgi:TRAP-type C4-dicarboxylate transport system permease small subunit